MSPIANIDNYGLPSPDEPMGILRVSPKSVREAMETEFENKFHVRVAKSSSSVHRTANGMSLRICENLGGSSCRTLMTKGTVDYS